MTYLVRYLIHKISITRLNMDAGDARDMAIQLSSMAWLTQISILEIQKNIPLAAHLSKLSGATVTRNYTTDLK